MGIAPFKVGDKVRITENGFRIRPEDTNTVSNVTYVLGLRCWCLHLEGHGSDRYDGFRAHRFALCEDQEPTTHLKTWVIVDDTGPCHQPSQVEIIRGTREHVECVVAHRLSSSTRGCLSFGELTDSAKLQPRAVTFAKI